MEISSNRGTLPAGRKPQKITRSKASKTLLETEKNTDAVITRDDFLVVTPSVLQRISEFIYKNLYIIGVQLIRQHRRLSKKANRFLSDLGGGLAAGGQKAVQGAGYGLRRFWRGIKAPFINIWDALLAGRTSYRKAKAQKEGTISSLWSTGKTMAKELWSIFSTALNYVVPMVAVIIFTTVISRQLAVSRGLAVIYNDQNIGYIKNESVFSSAVEDVKGRLMENLKDEFTFSVPSYQIVEMADGMDFASTDNLADNIIGASSTDFQQAFGLYANGKLVGAIKDSSTIISDELDKIKYANRTGLPNERVELQKTVSYKKGLFPSSSIIETQELIDIMYSTEKSELIYSVALGDTPSIIAYNNNISLADLAEINPSVFTAGEGGAEIDPNDVELRTGQKLYIVRENQFFSVKNIYTEVYNEAIPFEVIKNQNYTYAASYYHIDRAGVEGVLEKTADITLVDGKEIDRNVTSRVVLSEPETELVTVGVDRSALPLDIIDSGTISTTGFAWPGNGGNVGTVLGGYAGHTGVDINNTGGIGSPIFASASGTVTTATFSGYGYGNHIRIAHSDGFVTLYAHCSQLYVSVGDSVRTGQVIGTVGISGNTTGPHLHFEIIQNGQIVNPTGYIGTSGPLRM